MANRGLTSSRSTKEQTEDSLFAYRNELACLLSRMSNRLVLDLDFGSFAASFPRPNHSSWIGNGVQFLKRHLSSRMFRDSGSPEPLLNSLDHRSTRNTFLFCHSARFYANLHDRRNGFGPIEEA